MKSVKDSFLKILFSQSLKDDLGEARVYAKVNRHCWLPVYEVMPSIRRYIMDIDPSLRRKK